MLVTNIYHHKKWFRSVQHNLLINQTNSSLKNITQIEVINMDKKCNCFGITVNLYDGGIHKNYAKLNITSEKSCGLDLKVKTRAK